MTELERLYRQSLVPRIAELEAALEALGRGGSLSSVVRIAHMLRGSGGTYGFPEVSRAAREVEEADPVRMETSVLTLLRVLRDVVSNEQSPHAGASDEPVHPEATPAAADRVRILLVDDDAEIRLLAGIVLRDAGNVVHDARDAESAAALVPVIGPDVILMDVMLGEDDGIDAATELMKRCTPATRLVFLTGATRSEQLERMRAAGAAGVIRKPFDPTTLAAQFRQILESAM